MVQVLILLIAKWLGTPHLLGHVQQYTSHIPPCRCLPLQLRCLLPQREQKERDWAALLDDEDSFRIPIGVRIEDSLDTTGLQTASLHEAIPQTNKGFQMLQRMGWNQGRGLGRNQDGEQASSLCNCFCWLLLAWCECQCGKMHNLDSAAVRWKASWSIESQIPNRNSPEYINSSKDKACCSDWQTYRCQGHTGGLLDSWLA